MKLTVKSTLKGGPGSGWYGPPKGTHTGEKHRKVGSGTAQPKKKAATKPKKPKYADDMPLPAGLSYAERVDATAGRIVRKASWTDEAGRSEKVVSTYGFGGEDMRDGRAFQARSVITKVDPFEMGGYIYDHEVVTQRASLSGSSQGWSRGWEDAVTEWSSSLDAAKRAADTSLERTLKSHKTYLTYSG